MKIQELKDLCRNKWGSVFDSLGVVVGDGNHTACPICGPGENAHRFRFDNKNGDGTWICTHCGAGDGLALVKNCINATIPECIEKIISLGVTDMPTNTQQPVENTDPAKALNAVWSASTPLTGKDQASKYLYSRGLMILPENVRFCLECYCKEVGKKLPAMVARVQNRDGKPISVHRTYLDGDKKADLETPRKMMTPTEKINGGAAVRLYPVTGDFLGIAEGIETACAASAMFSMPVWSAIDAGKLETFLPPEGVRSVTVFIDNDANYAGQKSGYLLCNRLYLLGYQVNEETPLSRGDWNDELIKFNRKQGTN